MNSNTIYKLVVLLSIGCVLANGNVIKTNNSALPIESAGMQSKIVL